MTTQPVEPGLPATLYKYLPPERIDILENMQVRFSRPSEFNDAFDSHYLVPKSQKEGFVARMRLKSALGVFCLTEKPDDQLMWVHYAKNHTGLVIGFNAHAPFFREEGRTLRKVVYQSSPNVFSDANLDVSFYKPKSWEYEREWRCVRNFHFSQSRLVTIESTSITHIIFGYLMETWQIARIMQYATVQKIQTHTQFLLSTPLPKSWTFENRPKVMSVCPTCEGDGYLMKDFESEDQSLS
jgi:hypothetical protein